MENIRTIYIGELHTKATHLLSGAEIYTDAPPDNNGKGEFFSPTDLVAAALGSCMLTIIGIVARRDGFSIDGTDIRITKLMGDKPRRIAEILITLTFPPNNYSAREKALIEASARACPVAKSLHPELMQSLDFIYL